MINPKASKPPRGAVILGIGQEFKRLDGTFRGWAIDPSTEGDVWEAGDFVGMAPGLVFAAPKNSEIARLNNKGGKEPQKAPVRVAKKAAARSPKKTSKPVCAPPDVEEDVLEEALRITKGDRQAQYGPPDQDFARTANMWSALFADKISKPFEARDVAMAMICLKLSRETHQRKRDNATDIAGYARCLHLCNQADELRQQKT